MPVARNGDVLDAGARCELPGQDGDAQLLTTCSFSATGQHVSERLNASLTTFLLC
jgi:hypothetical protein